MIDIHCHILPGYDDGAEDIREALAMAALAEEAGVEAIVATPHFRGEAAALGDMPRLMARYTRLAQEIRRQGLRLRLFPGAEILCLPETAELAAQRQLPTLSDTDYLLAEFFFNESPQVMDMLLRQLSSAGYRPVIAHPERYEAVQEDPGLLPRWFGQGYVIQLNKGSVLGAFGPEPERTAHWALERGLAHIVASDAHSARRRTTDMRALRARLLELYPGEYVQLLLRENPLRLLRNREMAPVE